MSTQIIKVHDVSIKIENTIFRDDIITITSGYASMDISLQNQITDILINVMEPVQVVTQTSQLETIDNENNVITIKYNKVNDTIYTQLKVKDESNQKISLSQESGRRRKFRRNRLVRASPGIRKLARELGAPLEEINGTGSKGRITQTDVKIFVRNLLSQVMEE